MTTFEIKGTTDWEKLAQLKSKNWMYLGPHHYYCKQHGAHFDPDGYLENDCQDAEPCWSCYAECEVKI